MQNDPEGVRIAQVGKTKLPKDVRDFFVKPRISRW